MDGPRVPAADASLRLRIPPDAKFGRYVRERVAGFATAHAVPDDTADELITAIGEALANAIEHSGCSEDIEVACWLTPEPKFMACVVDNGIGFDIAASPILEFDPLTERGRGLPIMRQYSDCLNVESAPGAGTRVTMARTVPCIAPSDLERIAG